MRESGFYRKKNFILLTVRDTIKQMKDLLSEPPSPPIKYPANVSQPPKDEQSVPPPPEVKSESSMVQISVTCPAKPANSKRRSNSLFRRSPSGKQETAGI